MAESEYVVDGKVQAGIFPEKCVHIWALKMLEVPIEKEMKYLQEDFEAEKGVRNPCWRCLYNGGICKSARTKYKENGEEFLIFPKINDVALT